MTSRKSIPLKRNGDHFDADINITKEEWLEMLGNPQIFKEEYLEMVKRWYCADGHASTHRAIMDKYDGGGDKSPYNGYVVGLGNRIMNHLDRFQVIDSGNKVVRYVIPFKAQNIGDMVSWELRDELIEALEEAGLVEDTMEYDTAFAAEAETLLSEAKNGFIATNGREPTPNELVKAALAKPLAKSVTGRIRLAEFLMRDPGIAKYVKDRAGYACEICGEPGFERSGGGLYAEAHHMDSISLHRKDDVDRMICVCATCHRVIHYGTGDA